MWRLQPKHTPESVAERLFNGLLDGTLVLERQTGDTLNNPETPLPLQSIGSPTPTRAESPTQQSEAP